mmetsp:Transcript_26725/g.89928  ORF Transcript_26725/g.89928 Transcript_26725/m.89928 type:complete len:279 (-) Transcript_26725:229-1065(-)
MSGLLDKAMSSSSSAGLNRAPGPAASDSKSMPTTRRNGVRMAAAFIWSFAAPPSKSDETPRTERRTPGETTSTKHLSTARSTVRGISPVGTASGASCSFKVCSSTYVHPSGMTTKGLEPQSIFFPSASVVPPDLQAKGMATLENGPEQARCSWAPHFWHCTRMDVALLLTRDADTMMPGTLRSLLTCSAARDRSDCGSCELLSKTCIAHRETPPSAACSSTRRANTSLAAVSKSRSCSSGLRWSVLISCASLRFRSSRSTTIMNSRRRHRAMSCSRYV